jgi:phosphatidylserine decarboxylase
MNGLNVFADAKQHQGIGTIKMRSKKQHELDPLAPSAAAAVVSPLAGLHKAQPITSAGLMELDDEDDEDEDVLADDGLSSSSDEEYEDALEEEEEYHLKNSPPDLEHVVDIVSDETIVSSTRPAARASSEDQVPKTASLVVPETSTSKAKPPKTPTRQTSLPGYFESKRQPSDSGTTTPATPAATLTPGGTKRRPIFKRTKSKTPGSKKNSKDFNFDASQQRDVLGIVILEIKGATDLPKLRNGRFPPTYEAVLR